MLYKFFIKQWLQPCPGDWTETVKSNLEEFDIPCDLQYLKSKSSQTFKKIVKTKAGEVALNILNEKKKKHSKMKNVNYNEMKTQNYLKLEGITVEQLRNVFKYRVRMAPMWENFKGSGGKDICPLCQNHQDTQAESFNCDILKQKIAISCNIMEIYSDDISLEAAKTVTEMINLREEMVKREN